MYICQGLYIFIYVCHSMDDFILDNLYSRNKSSQKIMSMLIRN